MVGDRALIDSEIAEVLITRLHSAGLQLHEGLALPLSEEVRIRIESAIDEIDGVINLVRVAAMGVDPPEESAPPS